MRLLQATVQPITLYNPYVINFYLLLSQSTSQRLTNINLHISCYGNNVQLQVINSQSRSQIFTTSLVSNAAFIYHFPILRVLNYQVNSYFQYYCSLISSFSGVQNTWVFYFYIIRFHYHFFIILIMFAKHDLSFKLYCYI